MESEKVWQSIQAILKVRTKTFQNMQKYQILFKIILKDKSANVWMGIEEFEGVKVFPVGVLVISWQERHVLLLS